jgi:hypothetical protein
LIVAFDPGRNLGVAWVATDGTLIRAAVIALENLVSETVAGAGEVVVGDGTGSEAVEARLRQLGIDYAMIDETGTTLEGRRLFFADHPPRGWSRLLPPGLRAPPRPIDDYAAYAIALRFLAQVSTGRT